jgi:hypothetical protein
MIVMRVRSVQHSVLCLRVCAKSEVATREEWGRHAHWVIFNAGDVLQQVRGALLAERAYWLVTCEIITSGPRSALRAILPRLVPAHLFLMLEIPGDMLTGLCGRRKLLTNSEIPRARLFGQLKKAGSEKLGMTLKEAVTRLGRFSHPEVLILR